MLNEAMRSARLVGLLAICGAVIAQPTMAQSGAQSDGRTTAGAQTLFQRLVEAGRLSVANFDPESSTYLYEKIYYANRMHMFPVEKMEFYDADGAKACVTYFTSSNAEYKEKQSDGSISNVHGLRSLRIDWTKVSEVKRQKYVNDDNIYVVVSGGTSTMLPSGGQYIYIEKDYVPLEITFSENMGDRVYQAAMFLKETCRTPSSLGRDTGF